MSQPKPAVAQPVPRLNRPKAQAALDRYVAKLQQHPAEARTLTVRAGIYTESGKLTKAFGG